MGGGRGQGGHWISIKHNFGSFDDGTFVIFSLGKAPALSEYVTWSCGVHFLFWQLEFCKFRKVKISHHPGKMTKTNIFQKAHIPRKITDHFKIKSSTHKLRLVC